MVERLPILSSSDIRHGSAFCVIGRRGTGKTTAVVNLLYHLRDRFKMCIVFSDSDEAQGTWSRVCGKPFVYKQWRDDIVQKLISYCSYLAMVNRPTSCALILDDIMADTTFMTRSKILRKVLLEGRHYGIWMFLLSQYANKVPRDLRMNFDYYMFAREVSSKQQQSLFEFFNQGLDKIKTFTILMDTYTRNRGILITSSRPRQGCGENWLAYYWYRRSALNVDEPPLSTFKLGAAKAIKWANDNVCKAVPLTQMMIETPWLQRIVELERAKGLQTTPPTEKEHAGTNSDNNSDITGHCKYQKGHKRKKHKKSVSRHSN